MNIELYNPNYKNLVEDFFKKCDIKNNSSWESIGTHKRGTHQIFLVFDGEIVVGMCFAHDFSKYYPNSYRIFTRTATLPNYRGWNSPKKKGMAAAAGCLAYTCKLQYDWAKANGAENILFTTNIEGGMATSHKLGKFLHKTVSYDDSFEWFDSREIYNCKQDVWRLLKKDILT
jgi:hypothetical protein